MNYQSIRLLVMQPTSFCNLDCAYCYLPNRHIDQRMSTETVDAVFTDLLNAPFLGQRLTVVWHAGEPLVAGLQFYLRAVESSKRLESRRCRVTHTIQTNATLIDDKWCEFVKNNDIRLGISLDGPAFIHDRSRKTKRGKGTHSQVMRGVEYLQKYDIDFYAICVLTRESLNYAREIFDFFSSLNLKRLCFNVEEIEGVHRRSSIEATDTEDAYRVFLSQFYSLTERTNMHVREFQSLRNLINSGKLFKLNTQCLPFSIVSVDAGGDFSSFSPELLSMSHEKYGRFVFGNINQQPFISMLDSPHFRRIYDEIKAGVNRCNEICEYFVLCGGGSPSNKLFENGTFDSTETSYCRLTKKALIDICLSRAELELGLKEGLTATSNYNQQTFTHFLGEN